MTTAETDYAELVKALREVGATPAWPPIAAADAISSLLAENARLKEACRDVESKIVDFEAGRINWRPDDFLMRVRAALHGEPA